MHPVVHRSGLEALGRALLAFTISRVGRAELNCLSRRWALIFDYRCLTIGSYRKISFCITL